MPVNQNHQISRWEHNPLPGTGIGKKTEQAKGCLPATRTTARFHVRVGPQRAPALQENSP